MRKILLILTSTFALSGNAYADGHSGAINQSQSNWEGFYAGLNAGYVYTNTGSNTLPLNGAGGAFGSHVGYLFQSQNFVYGAEVDFELNSTKFHITGPGITADLETDYILRAKARAGFVKNDYLFSAHAGLARAQLSLSSNLFNTVSSTDDGFTLGTGIEKKFDNDVSIGIDYTYTFFENGFGFDRNTRYNSFKVKVSKHF